MESAASGPGSHIALLFILGFLYSLLIAKVSAKSHYERLQDRDPVDLVLSIDPNSMLEPVEKGKDPWDDPAGDNPQRPLDVVSPLDHAPSPPHPSSCRDARFGPDSSSWCESEVAGASGSRIDICSDACSRCHFAHPHEIVADQGHRCGTLASMVAGGWSLVILGFAELPTEHHWVGVHVTTYRFAFLMFVFGIVTAIFSGLASLGAFAIGAQLGAAFGISVAAILEVAIGVGEIGTEGSAYVAVAMLYMFVALTLIALLMMRPWDGEGLGPQPDDNDGGRSRRLMTMLRRLTVDVRIVFKSAALVGIVLGSVALFVGCLRAGNCSPDEFAAPSDGRWLGLFAVVAVVLAWWAAHRIYGGAGVLVPIGAGVLVGAVILGYLSFSFLGLQVDLERLVGIAITVTILIPASFILTSLLRGFRDAERRRKVGILWDVASFFPRWYHPLAPPSYGRFVVKKLGEELGQNPRKVLSAHSQGAMIALVTLGQLEDGIPDGFLTYGCQLGLHYPERFPTIGIPELVGKVAEEMGTDRWVNLWRPNDPLGGEVKGPVVDRQVDEAVGHSRYEVTDAFQQTRDGLL